MIQREQCIRIFGEFRLLEELGRGGMGKVYLGKDSFDNRVAIKVLLAKQDASADQLKRFSREAEIMAKLNHRNICRINKVGEIEHSRYISMEYLDGSSLYDLIGEKGLNLNELYKNRKVSGGWKGYNPHKKYKDSELIHFTLVFFSEILAGLLYAHQHGILHRDLKPSNVMCRREGEPVIMDFGLAKFDISEEQVEVSTSGQMVGTIEYVAPEQAAGDANVDFRADIYSAAAMLYYLLTGHKYFESSGNILTDIRSLESHRGSKASIHRKAMTEDLDMVLMTALDADPKNRYKDVEMFLSDIKACLEDKPVMARRQNTFEQGYRVLKRHKAISATVAVSVMLIVTMFITHFFQMSFTLGEYERVEKIAKYEQEKSKVSLQQLRKSLDKAVEKEDWEQSKDLAYKILSYDRSDDQAQNIIFKSDFEMMNKIWPFIDHPSSGFLPRIRYLDRAIEKWQSLVEEHNPYAIKVVDQMKEKRFSEKEKVSDLKAIFKEFKIDRDNQGHFLTIADIVFRYIPPGRFKMGDIVSKPIHDILIDRGFFMSETEVTQETWMKVFDTNPSLNQFNKHLPVTNVSWADSLTFCNALNEQFNYQTVADEEDISRVHLSLLLNRRGFRLPTEAEWEYACRADLPNRFNFWWESPQSGYSESIPPLWYKETSGFRARQ